MRPRILLPVLLVALALALLVLGAAHDRPDRRPPHPSTATAPMRPPFDFGPTTDMPFTGWVEDVLPMHRAVRRALDRFNGKVLDITLVPQRPGGPDSHPLVYRIRILTERHDLLDIRMDAFTGRFIEVRGADLGSARADRKDH